MATGESEEIFSSSILGSFGALEWKLLMLHALENSHHGIRGFIKTC